MNLNWNDHSSHVLFNPSMQMDASFVKKLTEQSDFPGHFWVATSGSSGQIKWVGLSKQAILASAHAVNLHLQSTSQDVWANALPDFHVSGLSIWTRAHLSEAKVVDVKQMMKGKWNPELFYKNLCDHRVTLCSLVPTQLYDLLKLGYSSLCHLRAVVIGGAALEASLFQQALQKGWPVLPSYGMTECASQIATASLGDSSAKLKILSHIALETNDEGKLKIKSSALLSCYASKQGNEIVFTDPKKEGWFYTEDIVAIKDGYLTVIGRSGNIVKIGGEKVNLNSLEQKLQALIYTRGIQATLQLNPDDRLGFLLSLIVEKESASPEIISKLMEDFHKEVLPYEKIRYVHFVNKIQRSPLGKPLVCELL